jgi:nicotinic acid phosphoribosyltransferase
MITQFGRHCFVFAVALDSCDIFRAVDQLWGRALRKYVIESGAMLVVQPDSGDPVETVAKTLEILAERFGANVNAKGLRVLRLVRVIEGDDVNPTSIVSIGTGRKSSIKRGQFGSLAIGGMSARIPSRNRASARSAGFWGSCRCSPVYDSRG